MTDFSPSAIVKPLMTYGTLLVTSLVLGCASVAPQTPDETPTFDARAALDQARANADADTPTKPVQAPAALEQDLLDLSQAPRVAKRFDVQADAVPVQRFFADLGRTQGVNILVDPAISGTLSLTLKSVTLDQVMSAVRDLYGYDYRRTDYGYRVLPNQIQTRIYTLDYLNVARSGQSDTTVSGGQLSSLGSSVSGGTDSGQNGSGASGGNESSSVTTTTHADFWSDMESTIRSLLDDGPGRQVVVNPQSGLLVVRATPREHEVVAHFLNNAQTSLQKQVVIEAKVVEVTLNQAFRSGINWNTFANDLDQLGSESGGNLAGDALSGIGGIGGVFSLSIRSGDFSSLLQLLSHQGDVQVLSSPRVSTVNNQKAVIKVGTDEFFVTNVSSATQNADTGQTTSPELTLSPFFSGIALDVTPQISAEDNVILHVRPSVTDVEERTKVINAAGEEFSLPLAYSSVRETDSIIRAASGQIVVIGGLLSQKQDNSNTGLPWLGRVPGLSYLFSQKRDARSKSELVILLKPVVYDETTTRDDLDHVLNRM